MRVWFVLTRKEHYDAQGTKNYKMSLLWKREYTVEGQAGKMPWMQEIFYCAA